jgi:hypothetical protein
MLQLATVNLIANSAGAASFRAAPVAPPELDVLMLFGFLSAFLTLVFFIHQRESRACVLALAVCLMATAVYGFLQGAFALAILQSVWAIATICRWHKEKSISGSPRHLSRYFSRRMSGSLPRRWESESRFSRMFGSTEAN